MLKEIGFTAVSIGAQSFHDPVLRHLHRPHDAIYQALAAVHHALDTFECVDVDLIVDVAPEEPSQQGAFLTDVRTFRDGCGPGQHLPADALRLHAVR